MIISLVEKKSIEGTVVYKVIFDDEKVSFVPLDEANTDYQAILEWVAEGNTIIDNGGGE